MKKVFILGLILGLVVLTITSCSVFPFLDQLFPSSQTTPVNETVVPPTVEPTPVPTATPRQVTSLTLWIPPQFQPDEGETAGNLFLSRLDEYASRRPQVDVKVRVKALEGEFGMLPSLRNTRDAAPLAMPDIIALPRRLAEEAFEEGLLLPLDERTTVMEDYSWFDYAQELSRFQDQLIGVPFAGDALVLAYKSDNGEDPPVDWATLKQTQKPLAFPASDPQSLITLAYYESLGGEVLLEEGQVQIQEEPFLTVLEFYQEAQAASVMPYWLTQFASQEQSWSSYQERQSTLALIWSSLYFSSEVPNTSLAAVPTQSGKPFSYATGWVWCVVGSDPNLEQEAIELVEFLVEDGYLDDWTAESGYLPTRPDILETWPEDAYPLLWQQILPQSVLPPEQDVLMVLGPEVRDAVVAVLKDQVPPETALADFQAAREGQ